MTEVELLGVACEARAMTEELGRLSSSVSAISVVRRKAVGVLQEGGWSLQRIADHLSLSKSAVQQIVSSRG